MFALPIAQEMWPELAWGILIAQALPYVVLALAIAWGIGLGTWFLVRRKRRKDV